jgi:hypothetical protein
MDHRILTRIGFVLQGIQTIRTSLREVKRSWVSPPVSTHISDGRHGNAGHQVAPYSSIRALARLIAELRPLDFAAQLRYAQHYPICASAGLILGSLKDSWLEPKIGAERGDDLTRLGACRC